MLVALALFNFAVGDITVGCGPLAVVPASARRPQPQGVENLFILFLCVKWAGLECGHPRSCSCFQGLGLMSFSWGWHGCLLSKPLHDSPLRSSSLSEATADRDLNPTPSLSCMTVSSSDSFNRTGGNYSRNTEMIQRNRFNLQTT